MSIEVYFRAYAVGGEKHSFNWPAQGQMKTALDSAYIINEYGQTFGAGTSENDNGNFRFASFEVALAAARSSPLFHSFIVMHVIDDDGYQFYLEWTRW